MKNVFENLKKNSVKKAYKLGELAHWFQRRRSGEKYFEGHPLKVADIIFKKWQEDENFEKINSEIAKKIEIAAYIHDTVEDTRVDLKDIEKIFGKEIALVLESLGEDKETRSILEEKGLSKREVKIKMLRESLKKINSLKKEKDYPDSWLIAATIRIADIIDNISDIDNLDADHRKRNLEKAEIIFNEFVGQIDLAESLGKRIKEIKKDLIN